MSDDLETAQNNGQAAIGSLQTYCIRAINSVGCDNGAYKSNPTCASITISWESSISGLVRAPDTAGKAPIKDVTITWYFVDYPEINGQGTTNADGAFVELFTSQLKLNIKSSVITGPQQVVVSVSKTSGGIPHQFTCNLLPCDSQIITLNNLAFDTFVEFVDISTVTLAGTVTIANTAAYNGDTGFGCPLKGVMVCAVDHYVGHENIACTSTDAFGTYRIPVAIGLNIEMVLSIQGGNHTFSRVSDPIIDQRALLGIGYTPPLQVGVPVEYFLVPTHSLSNLNYEDTTTVNVAIQVAGGLCNRALGDSIVYVTSHFCPKYKNPLTLQTYQTIFPLPAQQLVVSFGAMMTDNVNFNLEVLRYLKAAQNNTASINLVNNTNMSQDPFTVVRFEYHPAPTLTLQIPGTTVPSCTDPKAVAIPVAKSVTPSNVTIYVTEQFPGVAACDWVEGNILVTSFLGELGGPNEIWSACRETACNVSIITDSLIDSDNNTIKANARSVVSLLIGYPVLFPPFTKSLYARMSTVGHKDVLQVT